MGSLKGLEAAHADRELKPELRTGSRTCQCAGCGHYFGGLASFDSHFAETDTYTCRTVEEMRAVGLVENKYGVWTGRAKAQHKQLA